MSGDRLPSEKRLSEQFDVSRVTVRSALADLEKQGMIFSVPHRGCFVAKEISDPVGLMCRTVGLITPIRAGLDSKIFGGTLSAVESGVLDQFQQDGYSVLLIHQDAISTDGCRQLLDSPPAGLIVTGPVIEHTQLVEKVLNKLSRRGVAVVVNSDEPEVEQYDRVVSDHSSGAYELTKWLVGQGRKRILRVWEVPVDRYWLKMRDSGYERAVCEANVDILPAVAINSEARLDIPEEFPVRVRHIAGYLLEYLRGENCADAILAVNDLDAYAIGEACRMIGVTPGRDILIAGYDNHWQEIKPVSGLIPPAVTVDNLNHGLGQELVRLLLKRMAGELPENPQRLVFCPKLLVIKESLHEDL